MKRSRRLLLTVLVGLCALSGAVSAELDFDAKAFENSIQEFTLDNGLKFIVLERHDAPVVSMVVWADVGSVDDPKGFTGLAHMNEHMAFKGTAEIGTTGYETEKVLIAQEDELWHKIYFEKVKGVQTDSAKLAALEEQFETLLDSSQTFVVPNAFPDLVKREGGTGLNAGTSYDFTMYHYSLPSNKIEFWFMTESERFLKPVYREFYRERSVIANERRQTRDMSPEGRLREEFYGLAYRAHPYGITIVGHMSDIENYSREAALNYFKEYYVPSNMAIALVGDVDAKQMKKLAEKYWGRLPNSPEPSPIHTVEPPQNGERRLALHDPSQPMLWMGWHIPDEMHPDMPAVNVLMQYLASGRTSALYKNLVKEKKIASSVYYSIGPGSKYPGVARVSVNPSDGHTNAECEAEVLKEIARVRDDMIPASEVEKVKARQRAEFVNSLDGNMGMAMELAAYQAMFGDWHYKFEILDRINAVTPEDVQRVAKEYLELDNQVVVSMSPEEG